MHKIDLKRRIAADKGRKASKRATKKKWAKGRMTKKAVNGLYTANHEGFEVHVHFMLLEHNLDFPAMGVMSQDFRIRKPQIRTNKGPAEKVV